MPRLRTESSSPPLGNSAAVEVGTLVRVKADKGFGFIRSDAGQDHFFHFSELVDGDHPEARFQELVQRYQAGEQVRLSFERVETPKGWRANAVQEV
jgi:cold shock CspA family protein